MVGGSGKAVVGCWCDGGWLVCSCGKHSRMMKVVMVVGCDEGGNGGGV